MITIYELLEVDEDASKEEIELAYSKLVYEYRQDVKFDEKTNKENELIINRLKMAYEILTDDAKRKRYDHDLAQKRAESLIESVTVQEEKKEEPEPKNEEEQKVNQIVNSQNNISNINNINQVNNVEKSESYDEPEELTQDEKNKIRKAAQQEFKQKLKKAKQAEAEYNEAYNAAYKKYMRKMGYEVKEPLTLKKVKRVIFAILVVILFFIILWILPPTKRMLVNLYENNFLIKGIIDLTKALIDTILGK